MNRVPELRKAFIANKKDHHLSSRLIGEKYGVCKSTALRWKRDIGFVPEREDFGKVKQAIIAHPDFGTAGLYATVSAPKIAKELSCSATMVTKLRRKHGILGFRRFSGLPAPVKVGAGYSIKDQAAWRMCRLTRGWKRPEGIDEHLEVLRNDN